MNRNNLNPKITGKLFEYYRKSKGLSRKEIADYNKVSTSMIQRFEDGNYLSFDKASVISKIYKIKFCSDEQIHK